MRRFIVEHEATHDKRVPSKLISRLPFTDRSGSFETQLRSVGITRARKCICGERITQARKCIYGERLHEHGSASTENIYTENDGTYDRKIAITAPPDISFTRGGSLVHRESMSMQLPHATEIQDESNAKNRGESKDHDAAQGHGRYSRTSWRLPDLAKRYFSRLTSTGT
jgi:hypothetical protein